MRQDFRKYCEENDVTSASQQYDNGLSAIEKELNVSVDLEYAKDNCRTLFEMIESYVSTAKEENTKTGNLKNWTTYLKKYVEYKNSLSINYWLFSPGKQAVNWNSDLKKGRMSIGFREAGDYSQYSSIQEIQEKVYDNNKKKNAPKMIMDFVSIKPGDFVFARRAQSHIIGYGIVRSNYKYDADEGDYPNYFEVDWKSVECEYDIKKIKNSGQFQITILQIEKDKVAEIATVLSSSNNEAVSTDGKEHLEIIPSPDCHAGYYSAFERNRIIFGAPGTGKSYILNEDRKLLLGDRCETDYERVTFHPDYSYAHFVGTYKPVPAKDKDENDIITYSYVPGPFMRVYVNALRSKRGNDVKPFLLIIEEINRANVAAVFGDIFQLLDRGDDQVSEYPIQASEDIKVYLAKELDGKPDDYAQIRIPDNMFIWATMNSADQGVFPMDTAFKRRWDFTYLGIDDSDEKIRGKYVYLGAEKRQKVEWNKLRKAINHFLAKEKINEDKQLGPYFISRSIVAPSAGDEIDRDKFIHIFKNKVIMYLFEDAAKQKRAKLFEGCYQNDKTRYSEICRMFDLSGIQIFNYDIQKEAGLEEITLMPTEETY